MKIKAAIIAILVAVLALVSGWLGKARTPLMPRVTVAFLGYTNALPFPGAPEVTRSHRAWFQITNHTALNLFYMANAVVTSASNGSPGTYKSHDLKRHGISDFMVSISERDNQWRVDVVTTILRPRPTWQNHASEIGKWLGLPRFFVGPAQTYPPFTNHWELTQH